MAGKTMRALFLEPGAKKFKEVQHPYPALKPGHVIVKVEASSVNPLDYKLRSGDIPGPGGILHGDVAGTVVESDSPKFKVGDAVFGCAGGIGGVDGALAEFMLADADLLALKPANLSAKEAAALPLVSITSFEALAFVKPGQKVLVHAAAGGVGHIAAQIAQARGYDFYTTVSTSKVPLAVEKLGLAADRVIDYTKQSVDDYVKSITGGEGFDFVFDTVGGANADTSVKALKTQGELASILGLSPEADMNAFLKAITVHFGFQPLPIITGKNRAVHGKYLQETADLVAAGKLKPLVDGKEFSLWDADAAHDYLLSGKAVGKVVVVA